MPVECYALVSFLKLDKKTKDWLKERRRNQRLVNEQALTRGLEPYPEEKVGIAYEEPILKLCHLKLVQPLGRRDSSPAPRWEVMEELAECNTRQFGRTTHVATYTASGLRKFLERQYEGIYEKDIPLLVTLTGYEEEGRLLEFYEHIVTIDDRKITKKQIRSLFPECEKMPLAIALDYVRDRI